MPWDHVYSVIQLDLYGGGDYDNPVRRQAVAEALGIDESWLPI